MNKTYLDVTLADELPQELSESTGVVQVLLIITVCVCVCVCVCVAVCVCVCARVWGGCVCINTFSYSFLSSTLSSTLCYICSLTSSPLVCIHINILFLSLPI